MYWYQRITKEHHKEQVFTQFKIQQSLIYQTLMQTFAELYYTNHGNANFLTSFNLESDHHYFNYSSLCKHFYHLAALTNIIFFQGNFGFY